MGMEQAELSGYRLLLSADPHPEGSLYPRFWLHVCYFVSFYVVTSFFVIAQLFSLVVPRLGALSRADRANFVCQVTSTVNSFYACYCTALGYWFFYHAHDHPAAFQCIITMGHSMVAYLVVDTFYKRLYLEHDSSAFLVLHHVIGVILVFFACMDSRYTHIKIAVTAMEFSNPFVNFRIILSVLTVPKKSTVYLTNAILMTGSFFLVRVGPIPFFMVAAYRVLTSPDDATSSAEKTMFYFFVVLSAMNIYWFCRMVRGVVRALAGGKIE